MCLPAPALSYQIERRQVQAGLIRLRGTTILQYDGPWEGGFQEWPSVEISAEGLPPCAEGYPCTVLPGNYDLEVQDYLEARAPGIWDVLDYGQEPRTLRITEEVDVEAAVPPLVASQPGAAGLLECDDGTTGPPTDQFVFGFTCGVHFDYQIVDFDWDTWGFTWLGASCCFEFNFDIGLRLPVRVHLDPLGLATEKDALFASSSVEPLNYSSAQFEGKGIPGHGGDEFVLDLEGKAGVFAEVAEVNVIDWGISVDEDASADFCTPFGSGTGPCRTFPLPAVDIQCETSACSR
jgi:hypothetical protein